MDFLWTELFIVVQVVGVVTVAAVAGVITLVVLLSYGNAAMEQAQDETKD